jgi:hypothetical protein
MFVSSILTILILYLFKRSNPHKANLWCKRWNYFL